jgi:hypothetical protein
MVFYFGFGIQNYGEKFEAMANSTITLATISHVILDLIKTQPFFFLMVGFDHASHELTFLAPIFQTSFVRFLFNENSC